MDSNSLIIKKIETSLYNEYFEKIKKEFYGKKVLIYGAGWAFEELNKKFDFKNFDVVAISDMKFTEPGECCGFKSIPPSLIKDTDFDVILMTLYYPEKAIKSLKKSKQITEKTKIEFVLDELIPQEHEFFEYLEKIKFSKHLEKLSKKLKDKKVVIYGAGTFFQTIAAYYDLSKLNVVALSDRKFSEHEKGETDFGYTVCAPDEIKDLHPDCVLVATRFFINIIEDLEENTLKRTKIKVRPLIKKPFMELWHEIWG